MERKDYIEYLIQEHCLPQEAIPEIAALLAQKLPHGEYLFELFALVDTWYYTEPDHARYDHNRARFPYPNEADLAAAAELQRKKRLAAGATPLVRSMSAVAAVAA